MRKAAFLLAILLSVCLAACSGEADSSIEEDSLLEENPLPEDIVYAAESGKYFDVVGNRINFSEDIYSIGLNYVIGWDVETLLPVKIYLGDKINGLRVRRIDSQYLFYNPLEIDIYGVVSEFADENAPLFFHRQEIEFIGTREEPLIIHGIFVFDGDEIDFYPEYSEEENFYYLHDPEYILEDFDFTYNDEIKIQPFAINCRYTANENGSLNALTKEDIEQLIDRDLPEDTEYLEADVYFENLQFMTHKANADEDPMRTNAYGRIKKIEIN